ncbi:glycerol transporter [Coelomomyces lativittatus]|nr:glycerol transporter [Coelomomyces lativittatus]KAJ1511357.1 glycerol transporter [Coelomomyces lativittatus]
MVVHGVHALDYLGWIGINYLWAKQGRGSQGSTWWVIGTWILNIGFMIGVPWLYGGGNESGLVTWVQWIWGDGSMKKSWYRGIVPWHEGFKFSILRMISFNLDYCWSQRSSRIAVLDTHTCPTTSRRTSLSDASLSPTSTSSSSSSPYVCGCPRLRNELPHVVSEYSWTHYFVYLMYPPLYFAGPIMSFNQFLSQVQHPYVLSSQIRKVGSWGSFLTPKTKSTTAPTSLLDPEEDFIDSPSSTLVGVGQTHPWKALGSWIMLFFLLELFLHQFHVMAITQHPQRSDPSSGGGVARDWIVHLQSFDWVVMALAPLFFVWMKLLLIWRFFRTVALFDGMIAMENMQSCVFMNTSVFQFWRDWHVSFNHWNRRYLYFPLLNWFQSPLSPKHRRPGFSTSWSSTVVLGARWGLQAGAPAWAIGSVFVFIALWHDLEWKLMVWALLVCLFLIPEYWVKKKWGGQGHRGNGSPKLHLSPWVQLKALGGALNIFLMITANLVGFVLGLEYLQDIVPQLTGSVLFGSFVVYYCVARISMYLRQPRSLHST